METRWHLAATMDDWLAQALTWVRRAEHEALASRSTFHIVLAGGDTPRLLYEMLAKESHDWTRWQIWFGDERCLPPDDPGRNSIMAQRSFQGTAIDPDHFLAIPAELGAEAAAREYARALAGVGPFDLVLLGIGEDGHTASLFPGNEWGTESDAPDVLPVHNAPKPPAERASLSARRLAHARQVLFLVTGAGKREAVARWRGGAPLPASSIQPPGGVDVLLSKESFPSGVHP